MTYERQTRHDRKPPHFNKFSVEKSKHKPKSQCDCPTTEFGRSNGEMLIVVMRSSFNIKNFDLPYFLFGNLYLQGGMNNAYNLLEPYLNGMTLQIDIINDLQVQFTYTEGANVDTITLFFPPVYSVTDYVQFIRSLSTNYFTSSLMTVNYNIPVTDFVPLLGIAQANIGNIYSMMGCPFLFYEIQSTSNVGGSKMAEAIYPASRLNSSQTIVRTTQFDMQYTTTTVDIFLNNKKINAQSAWITFFKSGMKTGFGFLDPVEGVMLNTVSVLLNEKVDLNERAEQVYNANTSEHGN